MWYVVSYCDNDDNKTKTITHECVSYFFFIMMFADFPDYRFTSLFFSLFSLTDVSSHFLIVFLTHPHLACLKAGCVTMTTG